MTKRTKKNAQTTELDTDAIEAAAQQAEQEAAALAEIEAEEIAAQATEDAGPAEEIPDEATDEAIAIPHVAGVFKDLMTNVTQDQKETKQKEVVAELSSRKAFEQSLPGLSGKMIPNLEAIEKKMGNIGTAAVFCAIDIDPRRPSSVSSTFASIAGSLTSQSFCGARRTRAPLAPPRKSDLRKVLAEAHAVLMSWLTVRPLAAILSFTAWTSASEGMVPAGTGSCQIRSSAGTSGPR